MSEKEEIMTSPKVARTRHRMSIKPVLLPSSRSLSLPSSTSSTPTKKKGWSLIKSLSRRGQITSLAQTEEEFLSALESTATPDKDPTDRQAARRRLRQTIVNKVDLLTVEEASFLNHVVEAPDVDTELLDNCAQVLEKDPLYLREFDEIDEKEKDETRKDTQKRRQSLLTDATFRTEIWKSLQKKDNSQQALTFYSACELKSARVTKEKDKKKKHEVEDVKNAPQEGQSNPWNAFVNKLQTMFKNDDQEDKEEDPEDDVEEEDHSFRILATSVEDLTQQPLVLSPPIMDALRSHLPFAVQQDNFWLKYSMVRDGAHMPTLMSKVRSSARTFLAIETDKGDVFGSFTSSPWRPYGKGYYGSGEAFLWRLRKSRYTPCQTVEEQIGLESDVEVFAWTGQNRNIQSTVNLNSDLVVGGGGADDFPEDDSGCGIGLTVTRDLERGFSDKCLTFGSPPLTARYKDEGMFRIMNLEVWTLTPVDSLQMAEKLELSRQFVFDHGNFLEQ